MLVLALLFRNQFADRENAVEQAALQHVELDDQHLTSTLLDEVEGSVMALDHHRTQTRSVAVALLAVTVSLPTTA